MFGFKKQNNFGVRTLLFGVGSVQTAKSTKENLTYEPRSIKI